MRRLRLALFVCVLPLTVLAGAGTNAVELSGILHRARAKEAPRPYVLDVTLAGGGTQRVLLAGETLRSFDEQIAISGGGCVPVRVKGHFRTEMKKYEGTAQPTVDGWLIWLEVEEASSPTVEVPDPKKEDANQPSDRTR